MEDYIYRKWKIARKGEPTLFSMLPAGKKVYAVIAICSLFLNPALFVAASVPSSPLLGPLTKQLFDIPFLTPAVVIFVISCMMCVALIFVVSPIDSDTERSRLDERYLNLSDMLAREEIANASLCEAICSSLESASEREMQRMKSKWEFVFAMLLFLGEVLGSFIVGYIVEHGSAALVNTTCLSVVLVLLATIFLAFSLFYFFSAKANTPRLKARCASELRIAFHLGQLRAGNQESHESVPRHMKR